jgi:predicted nucleic acid-binding protein
MARAGKKTIYWDTASFIAWLDGGKGHPKDVVAGFDEVALEVTHNRANLCTSVLTQTEVLQGRLTIEQATKFDNLFKRRSVISITVDTRIAKRASEIRNYYSQKGVRISTPDSIHLASAIIYEVDEFHTLDGDGQRQRPNDLLRLNGDVAGYPLHIRVPVAVQPSLLAGVGPLPLDDKTTLPLTPAQPEAPTEKQPDPLAQKLPEVVAEKAPDDGSAQKGNGELQHVETAKQEIKVAPDIAADAVEAKKTEQPKEKGPSSL